MKSASSIVASALFVASAWSSVVPPSYKPNKVDAVSKSTSSTSTSTRFYNGTCTADSIRIRTEWRNMQTTDQQAYLAAVQCLMALPAQTSLQGVTNRFSDLQALHRDRTNSTVNGVYVQDIIHSVGQFLPWHRWYVAAEEHMLRSQCSYTGPLPWWDEAKDADAGDFFQSSMWDADAFGGDGDASLEYCVTDGAFANYTVYMGPQLEDTTYCMDRQFNNTRGLYYGNSGVIAECMAYDNYPDFMTCMHHPHKYGHEAVGGTEGVMSDIDNSPADPVFFMHHAYIDRVWWKWQSTENVSTHMYNMGGYAYNVTYLEDTADYTGTAVNVTEVTTLDYIIDLEDILPDIAIREVMNIQGGALCYDYDY